MTCKAMLGFTLGPNLFIALPHLATPELVQDLVHVFALQGGLRAQRRADFIRGRARSRFALRDGGLPDRKLATTNECAPGAGGGRPLSALEYSSRSGGGML